MKRFLICALLLIALFALSACEGIPGLTPTPTPTTIPTATPSPTPTASPTPEVVHPEDLPVEE